MDDKAANNEGLDCLTVVLRNRLSDGPASSTIFFLKQGVKHGSQTL